MDLLKRTLYWEAGLLAAGGLFAALFPAWLLQTLFAQPPEPLPWVRIAGVQALGFADDRAEAQVVSAQARAHGDRSGRPRGAAVAPAGRSERPPG